MHMWRYAVITYLREAFKAQALHSDLSAGELGRILKTQYERWWNINIDRSMSKSQFLRYAGRYVRRPPIAQHRFVEITDGTVRFWTKDLKLKRRVITEYSLEEFVAALAEHVPDRYRHAIRYFGLLAPRSKTDVCGGAFPLAGLIFDFEEQIHSYPSVRLVPVWCSSCRVNNRNQRPKLMSRNPMLNALIMPKNMQACSTPHSPLRN